MAMATAEEKLRAIRVNINPKVSEEQKKLAADIRRIADKYEKTIPEVVRQIFVEGTPLVEPKFELMRTPTIVPDKKQPIQ